MTDLSALIAKLRAELDSRQGVVGVPKYLVLSQDDARTLLHLLEFVEDMRLQTLRGAS